MSTSALITQLCQPDAYPHPVRNPKLIETHISWVILTGEYVYKIKKPLDLGFLDYSTLEKRQFFCEEEIRLNKRLAPHVYLEVVPITGSEQQPQINGAGPVIEYAVKMREFPQANLLDALLDDHALPLNLMNQLASQLAEFHLSAAVCPATNTWGSVKQVYEPVQQNFEQIRDFLTAPEDITQLTTIATWAEQQHQQLNPIFQQRKQQHYIRECHGDIHLGNIAMVDDAPVIFDCIEFNPGLIWTDVMADVGFLLMDLEYHHYPDMAHRFLNEYLHMTGDYAGLSVLNYYKSYRAVVRAKISKFHLAQAHTAEEKAQQTEKYQRCMQLAESYLTQEQPRLFITHGLSAAGKSTVARQLVDATGCIQLISDVERKRLTATDLLAQNNTPVLQGIYHPDITEQTYQHLLQLAEGLLNSGYSVVVDACFLHYAQRQAFQQLATRLQVPFTILHCQASEAVLHRWLEKRHDEGGHYSEARKDILQMQQQTRQPLRADEQHYVLNIDMEKFTDIEQLLPAS